MQLAKFKVTNFRSVNDSGPIDVAKMTALVGRNESGKSNILLALESLNPPGGPRALTLLKDFPRDRPRNAFSNEIPVVETVWILSEEERAEIDRLWKRTTGITEVTVSRGYSSERTVTLKAEPLPAPPIDDLARKLRSFEAKIEVLAGNLPDGSTLAAAFQQFKSAVIADTETGMWPEDVTATAKAVRRALAENDSDLGKESDTIDLIEDLAIERQQEAESAERAERQVLSWLPTFIYIADYVDIAGHTDVGDYINHPNRSESAADRSFAKLCKVANLDPAELLSADHENRMLMNNRAGALITRRIRELWSDRRLKIRFNMDGRHFDTLVSDPNNEYDVEVNLDERSRGLRWFFSFFVTYLADTDDGPAANAILLLDEPGLFLHAGSQRDLLQFLKTQIPVQSIYTTHSPFMVPHDDLDAVRTVNIGQDTGTTVSNDPSGDSKTLFPIQAALGYDLAQSLFVGPKNLIVEGVTDFWILSTISNHLRSIGRTGLDENIAITPAGGAQKVPYMVALLTSQDLGVVVLLDDEKQSRSTGRDLKAVHHFSEKAVLFVTAAFESPPNEADIEDLLGTDAYVTLALESHTVPLAGQTPQLDARIPRVVRRLETAFGNLSVEFSKTKVARLLLRRFAEREDGGLPDDGLARFERLFKLINQRFGS